MSHAFSFRRERRPPGRVYAGACAVLGVLMGAWMLLAPGVLRATALEESAHEMAQKIAAGVHAPLAAAVQVNNGSSLDSSAFARIAQAVRSELRNAGIQESANSDASVAIAITLGENARGFVWVVEIRLNDQKQFSVWTVPPTQDQSSLGGVRMLLHSELLWRGPERVVDVVFLSASNSEPRMVLLLPTGLLITTLEKGAPGVRIDFPPGAKVQRDPRGTLSQAGPNLQASIGGETCRVALDTATLLGCDPSPVPPEQPSEDVRGENLPNSLHGDESRQLSSRCGIDTPLLAAGAGDDTETDSIRVFDAGTAVSDAIAYPGPVLTLTAGRDAESSTAIVHNLQSGNYELYQVSISCAP